MTHRYDPEGIRLPIKIDSTSNGEFAPIPLDMDSQQANAAALAQATRQARHHGVPRRQFLVSSLGAACTLLALNQARAAQGKTAGYFDISNEQANDPEAAEQVLADREFILDVQGHYVRPGGHMQLKSECAETSDYLDRDYMRCLGADSFIQDVFLDSDTDMMVLSFVPSTRDAEPLSIEEAAATRDIIANMKGTNRLLLHGRVNPNQEGDVADMPRLAEEFGVSAWKCYTQWGPDGKGFYLTDDVGIAFIEQARNLGVKNICIHKGIPFGQRSYEHSICSDVGAVAKQFPDVNFLIYHSGWIPGQAEGPYDPDRGEGIDALIQSVLDAGVADQGNVYAELGSTWRGLMRDPDSAAHAMGKLLKYLGPDNVLYGSDSVWYGSPQDQILALRTFQISEALREQYDYPEISADIRAKLFGLNGARVYNIDAAEIQQRMSRDPVTSARTAYREEAPNPHFLTNGPQSRRAFLNLMKLGGGPA